MGIPACIVSPVQQAQLRRQPRTPRQGSIWGSGAKNRGRSHQLRSRLRSRMNVPCLRTWTGHVTVPARDKGSGPLGRSLRKMKGTPGLPWPLSVCVLGRAPAIPEQAGRPVNQSRFPKFGPLSIRLISFSSKSVSIRVSRPLTTSSKTSRTESTKPLTRRSFVLTSRLARTGDGTSTSGSSKGVV